MSRSYRHLVGGTPVVSRKKYRMPDGTPVGLRDIARQAGISPSTVWHLMGLGLTPVDVIDVARRSHETGMCMRYFAMCFLAVHAEQHSIEVERYRPDTAGEVA